MLCPLYELVHKFKERVKLLLNYGSMIAVGNVEMTVDPARKGAAWIVMVPLLWLSRLSFICAVAVYLASHRRRIDILHVHESNWIAGAASIMGQLLHLPVICKEADFPSLGKLDSAVPFKNLMDKKRREVWFIAQHEAAKKDLIDKGINVDRITIVPNGVIIPLQSTDLERRNQVICVGNFTQGAIRKGFDILIKAWSIVIKECSDARLILIGRGYSGEWVEMARLLGCQDSIDFVGWQDDVESCYSRAAFLVLPSRIEGMSNVLIEAQSFGLPAVVSDIPGNLSIVVDGETGIVAENGNDNDFADGIIRLLKDSALRKRMGVNARSRMIEFYNIDHTTDLLIKCYESVLAVV
jgi:glycosyltransferase involved in cell wall biosynthesis